MSSLSHVDVWGLGGFRESRLETICDAVFGGWGKIDLSLRGVLGFRV